MKRGSTPEVLWSLRWGLLGLTLGVAAAATACSLVLFAGLPYGLGLAILAAVVVVGIPVTHKLGQAGRGLDDGREAREAIRDDDPDGWLR